MNSSGSAGATPDLGDEPPGSRIGGRVQLLVAADEEATPPVAPAKRVGAEQRAGRPRACGAGRRAARRRWARTPPTASAARARAQHRHQPAHAELPPVRGPGDSVRAAVSRTPSRSSRKTLSPAGCSSSCRAGRHAVVDVDDAGGDDVGRPVRHAERELAPGDDARPRPRTGGTRTSASRRRRGGRSAAKGDRRRRTPSRTAARQRSICRWLRPGGTSSSATTAQLLGQLDQALLERDDRVESAGSPGRAAARRGRRRRLPSRSRRRRDAGRNSRSRRTSPRPVHRRRVAGRAAPASRGRARTGWRGRAAR